MSFHGPFAMAKHGVYVCVRPWRRRLFALGIPASNSISFAGKWHSPHPLNVSDIRMMQLIFPHCAFRTTNKPILSADPLSGLLLSRTWVFTGNSRWLAWIFSMLLLGYLAATAWGYALYTTIYDPKSPDACIEALANARHRVGVGIVCIIPIHITDHGEPPVSPGKIIHSLVLVIRKWPK